MNHIISYHRWQRSSLAAILLAGFLLLISPLSAVAQSIEWSPLDMNFAFTVIGTTATQTLTLTNTDEGEVLVVGQIEWTYNDPGEITGEWSFQFIADRPVPAELLPGESMEIDITFTPETFSFKMANLLITNSSGNAPGLNYFVMGDGVEGDPCAPMTLCDGTCIDTTSDLNNCGACGNVCPTPENAIATCEVSACNFICDDGYEPVGSSCMLIISQTPKQLMDALVEFVDQSVESGALMGLGPSGTDQAGEQLLRAFVGILANAQGYIDAGTPVSMRQACGSLNFAQLRSDGGWPFVMPPDFVAGEASREVYDRIIGVMDAIEGCEPSVAPTRPQH